MREVRFSVDRDWATAAHGAEGFEKALPVTNSWGGWPSAVGIAPYLVLRVVVSGRPDAVTGYLVGIQELDKLLRNHAIPLAARRLHTVGARLTGESLVRGIWDSLAGATRQPYDLEELQLSTTPYLSYTVEAGDESMTSLTQSFEFSASHRLHIAALSDEENRRQFGKCNNPSGHGHNYRVEVTLIGEVSEATGSLLPLPAFESIVKRDVIDRLDHKHLNTDVPEFSRGESVGGEHREDRLVLSRRFIPAVDVTQRARLGDGQDVCRVRRRLRCGAYATPRGSRHRSIPPRRGTPCAR